jgi:Ni/Fe-hydrogenase 1 B-type cytochrome subunit
MSVQSGHTEYDHPLAVKITHHTHWISMVALVVSGLYIHYPWAGGLMDPMRYIHFVAMYVLAATFVVRIYYALFGTHRDISLFLPQKENKGTLFKMIKYYLFIQKEHPATAKFNPLQKATYNLWSLLLVLQGLTGFALYWPQSAYFEWFVNLSGGLPTVRLLHFAIMWLFIVTSLIHVYLTFAEDFASFKLMFFLRKAEK